MDANLTPHRRAVLEIVRFGKDHPTAREVFERSSTLSPRLSFATVYNALKYLTDTKFLRVIRVGEDALRYDPVGDRHDHLVCRICNGIQDAVGMIPPEPPRSYTGPQGFLVESVNVQFQGICAQCRKPETSNPKKKPSDKKQRSN